MRSGCIFKQVKKMRTRDFDNGREASNSKRRRRKKNVSNSLIDSFSTTITTTQCHTSFNKYILQLLLVISVEEFFILAGVCDINSNYIFLDYIVNQSARWSKNSILLIYAFILLLII